ncbi:hypothetical protein IEQ34_021748 [Dendrobium chrysotoxum]|uniref:Uncharacterized protein n=1 Tax=Dendrobium chrysotoxum TaxID=161865 RepID=A0AAV7G4C4_DENCH|nr:hypothetical protein IEQ34_021748 [Dendrobium chrysotoxum]
MSRMHKPLWLIIVPVDERYLLITAIQWALIFIFFVYLSLNNFLLEFKGILMIASHSIEIVANTAITELGYLRVIEDLWLWKIMRNAKEYLRVLKRGFSESGYESVSASSEIRLVAQLMSEAQGWMVGVKGDEIDKHLQLFMRLKPPLLQDVVEPQVVKDWLMRVKRSFDSMQC